MRLLALDQASRITGYAIFDKDQLTEVGKISLAEEDVNSRLVTLREKIKSLIEANSIEAVAIEDIQLQNSVGNNVVTYKVLAEVFGVISELVTELNLPLTVISSNTWKSTCAIPKQGRAKEKKSAQEFVERHYNKKVTQDEADAICIGHHFSLKKLG